MLIRHNNPRTDATKESIEVIAVVFVVLAASFVLEPNLYCILGP
jgi:hypothetical protein